MRSIIPFHMPPANRSEEWHRIASRSAKQKNTPSLIFVVTSVWMLSVAALVALWQRKPRTVLDLWLMVVMCAWFFDVALSAVLNAGRFDLGFYAGRIYGLLAASFVLIMLGLLFIFLAPFLRFYATPRVEKAPLDLYDNIVSTGVVCATPDMSTRDASELMREHQVRRLPVVENERIIGIVSLGDLAVKEGKDRRTGDTLQEISEGVKESY